MATNVSYNINLIPPEIHARQKAEKAIVYVVFGFACWLILLGLLYTINSMKIAAAEENLVITQEENTRVLQAITDLTPFKQRKDLADQKSQVVATALTGEIKYFKLMNELAIVMPSNAKTDSISFTGSSMSIAGAVVDAPGDFPDTAFADLADFWVKFENIDSFDNTFIGNYSTDGRSLPYGITAIINTNSPSLR